MADPMEPPDAGPSDDPRQNVRHARTASVLAIAELAGKVASFAMFVVAARVLGPAELGQFSWSFNLALLVSVFVVWGFDTALIQLSSLHRSRLDALLSNLLAIRALLTPAALVLVALVPAGANDNLVVSLVLALAVLADSSNQAIRSAAAVLQKQREVAVNLVVQRLATAGLAVAVLLSGGGVAGMSWAYLAGTLVGVALMFWSAHRIGLSPRPHLVSRAIMGELVRGSTAIGISTTLNMLAFRFDTLMLGWMLSNTAVGAYSAAYKLFETALFVLWSVDRVALPAMTASEGKGPIRRGVHHASSAMFALYVPYIVLLVLRGEEILNLFFGSPYGTDSLASLQVLALALIPYSLQYLLASGLLARTRNKAVTYASLTGLVVNILANLVLIPVIGTAGAAAATFLAMTAQAMVLWVVLFRMAGSPQIVRASLVALIAGTLMAVPLFSPLPLIVATILAGLVYTGVWFLAASRLDTTARDTVLGMVGLKK